MVDNHEAEMGLDKPMDIGDFLEVPVNERRDTDDHLPEEDNVDMGDTFDDLDPGEVVVLSSAQINEEGK